MSIIEAELARLTLLERQKREEKHEDEVVNSIKYNKIKRQTKVRLLNI